MNTILSGRGAAWLSRCAVLSLVAFFASAGGSYAAGLLSSASSADVRSGSGPTYGLGALVKRSRTARIDLGELARHVAPLNADTAADRIGRSQALDGVVSIELFPDVAATFVRTSVDDNIGDGYAWVGRVDDNPLFYASLIVANGEVNGHIQLGHNLFRILPAGNGVHAVVELDASKFPADDPPDNKVHDHKALPGKLGETKANSRIDVLAAYTSAAKTEAGGTTNIKNEIKQAVSLANVGYANTGIPITIKLVHIMSAGSYVEQANIQTDLNRLDGDEAGYLSNVRTARGTYNADLVSLFRKNDPTFCGIANLTDHPSGGTSNLAYHVMNRTCVSNLSFHHEMGHNMGLRHDVYVDPTPGVHYNHGYVNTGSTCRLRSVMAYNNKCADSGFNCTRVNAFSTGDYVWLPSGPSGPHCKLGTDKSGTKNRQDNTQRLKETRGTISGYN